MGKDHGAGLILLLDDLTPDKDAEKRRRKKRETIG